VRKRKASVTDITQWRLWRQTYPADATGWKMRQGEKCRTQSFPIHRPYDRYSAAKPTGRTQVIPFRRAG
jgi:hypothetical protein